MKTQTSTKKYSLLILSALSSLVLIVAACQKKSDGGASTPAPVVVNPADCALQPCPGAPGQVALYGGLTTGGFYTQAQFQVTGDQTGTGLGSIRGKITINNYVCQLGQPNLNGPYTIQMSQQGYLQNDVFTGSVTLVGPQGSIPAFIKVIPSRVDQAGLFTVYLCGYENSSNF